MSDGSHDELYGDGSSRRRSGAGGERPSSAREPTRSEVQQAVDRLEQAVYDLVGSATSEIGERATAFLNEATARIEEEFGSRGGPDSRARDAAARMRARRRARSRMRSETLLERSPRLARDVENAKICGVCAGIANYYGVEHWVVRCIAVTGLLFFGSIVFPAYWIMYFVMDDPRKTGSEDVSEAGRRQARGRGRNPEQLSGLAGGRPGRGEEPPRHRLKHVKADIRELELRLRRMETHVTSGQFELQRELHRIEAQGPSTTPAGA